MSEINSKNYTGANVVIVGVAGGAPEETSFLNGGEQTSLSIAVSTGYKQQDGSWKDTGTNWYTLTAKSSYAQENWPNVVAGDKVRVDDARLELKAYVKKDGTPAVDARLKFGTLVIVEAKSERPPRDYPEVQAPW
jgi:single-stranded DNA-binding protein